MNRIPMTINGEKILRKKLKILKEIKRPKIISLIIDARKFGDLKENAEYNAAKEEQIICEKKINEIENKLIKAQIIDISKINKKEKVIFGSTITIFNINNKKIYKYRIVGDDESDIKKNLISINSPLARGLIGKKKKNICQIKTPIGKTKYKIIKIEYI